MPRGGDIFNKQASVTNAPYEKERPFPRKSVLQQSRVNVIKVYTVLRLDIFLFHKKKKGWET